MILSIASAATIARNFAMMSWDAVGKPTGQSSIVGAVTVFIALPPILFVGQLIEQSIIRQRPK
jgi:hypothetical protein